MQKQIISILLLIFVSLYSALPMRSSERKYTLEECQELYNEGKLSDAFPSLIVLRAELEDSSQLDEDAYAYVILMLLSYYANSNELVKAQNLLSEAFNYINNTESDANTELTRMLWIQGGHLESSLHNYEAALNYYNQAQWMYEDQSVYDNGYCFVLSCKGQVYMRLGNIFEAKLFLDEAKQIFEETFGGLRNYKWPMALQLYNSLGLLEQKQHHYQKALELYQMVVDEANDDVVLSEVKSTALMHQASIYCAMGQWNKALSICNQIRIPLSPENQPSLLQALMLCNYYLGDKRQTLKFLHEYNTLVLSNVQTVFTSFSEVERDEYWNDCGWLLNLTNNMMAYVLGSPDAIKTGFAFNAITRRFNNNFKQLISNVAIGSIDLQNTLKKLHRLRSDLAYGCKTAYENDSIARSVIHLEREILKNVDLKDLEYDNTLNCIKSHISDNDILIDFIYLSYPDSLSNIHNDYGAYVVDKQHDCPIIIDICNREMVDKYLINENMDEVDINNLYSASSGIYTLLMKKLESYISGKNRIFVRQTGLLSKINLGALKNTEGQTLSDLFEIFSLSDFKSDNFSTAEQHPSITDINLYGAIDYNNTTSVKYEKYFSDNLDISQVRGLKTRGKFGTLPGTRLEIEQIDSIFSTHKIKTQSWAGSNASELAFKQMSGNSPNILHIATHGFFINTAEEYMSSNFLQHTIEYSKKSFNMFFSGLLLAGANRVWNDGELPNPIDDGILTSDEISRLDLSQTKLLVLSACETGQGFVDNLDGVMGMQLAFKHAGVGSIVMSLWKVPDIATSILMKSFYEELCNGSTIRQSLKRAQKYLIELGYTDPYYWASFVVLD